MLITGLIMVLVPASADLLHMALSGNYTMSQTRTALILHIQLVGMIISVAVLLIKRIDDNFRSLRYYLEFFYDKDKEVTHGKERAGGS